MLLTNRKYDKIDGDDDYKITYEKSIILDVECPGANSNGNIQEHIQQHTPNQWNFAYKDSCHVKLMSPWLVKSDTDIDFMMHDPTWHKEKQMGMYTLVPGIVNFKYQPSTAINMFLTPSEKSKTIELEAGAPMAYLTPLGNVNLKIKTELISHERWNQMLKHRFSFTNLAQKTKKFIMRRNNG